MRSPTLFGCMLLGAVFVISANAAAAEEENVEKRFWAQVDYFGLTTSGSGASN